MWMMTSSSPVASKEERSREGVHPGKVLSQGVDESKAAHVWLWNIGTSGGGTFYYICPAPLTRSARNSFASPFTHMVAMESVVILHAPPLATADWSEVSTWPKLSQWYYLYHAGCSRGIPDWAPDPLDSTGPFSKIYIGTTELVHHLSWVDAVSLGLLVATLHAV